MLNLVGFVDAHSFMFLSTKYKQIQIAHRSGRFEIAIVCLDRDGLSAATQGAHAAGAITKEGSTSGFIAQKIGATGRQHEDKVHAAERTGRGEYASQEVNEASGQAAAAVIRCEVTDPRSQRSIGGSGGF